MSRMSIFKYNANGNEVLIRQLINDYLTTRNFIYNEEEQAYMFTPKDKRTMKEKIAEGAVQGLVGALTGTVSVRTVYEGSFCFNYSIENGYVIIKAYLKEKNGFKNHITQSSLNRSVPADNYYNDLKKTLFQSFENNNISLIEKSVEKIQDGKMSPATSALLITFGVMIAFIAFIIIYFKINMN